MEHVLLELLFIVILGVCKTKNQKVVFVRDDDLLASLAERIEHHWIPP